MLPTHTSPPPSACIAPLAAVASTLWEFLQANADTNTDAVLVPPEGETLKDNLAMTSKLVWGAALCTMQTLTLAFLF